MKQILERIRAGCAEILRDHLVGIYVHGSIAFGCFNPRRSDIDFLIVTDAAPSHEQKKRLIGLMLELDPHCPAKGLEMSVVLSENCSRFVYPTPFELHFSNAHKQRAQQNLDEFCLHMNGVDPDLAAHFTVTRAVGITLCGKPVNEVFAPVPREDYLNSLRYDVENAAEDIRTNPVYIILNLCRIAAYLHEGCVLSKKDGGLWGLARLPQEYHSIIRSALGSYTCGTDYLSDDALEQRFVQTMHASIFPE